MSVSDDGLRQRPTPTSGLDPSAEANETHDASRSNHNRSHSDMAYGSTSRNSTSNNRPLATSIRRTISSGLYSSKIVLRRYYHRILLVFTVTAAYTAFLYTSGASRCIELCCRLHSSLLNATDIMTV